MNDVGMCSSLSATPVLASASLSPTAMDAGEDAAPLQLDDVIGIVLSHLSANSVSLAPPSHGARQFSNAEQLAVKLSILCGRAEMARMAARLRAVSKSLRVVLTDLSSARPRVNGALLWAQALAIARIVEIFSCSECKHNMELLSERKYYMRTLEALGVRLEELCTPDTGNMQWPAGNSKWLADKLQWPADETPAEVAAPKRWDRLKGKIVFLVLTWPNGFGEAGLVNELLNNNMYISAILADVLPQVA